MKIKEILTLIKNNEIFEYLFMYVDDVTDENINIFFDYDKENIEKYNKFVFWLYLSNFTYGYIVGINNEGKIFALTNELDEIEYCDNVYEIPFCFWYEEYSLNNEDYSTVGMRIKLENFKIYNLLIEYKKFIEEKGIKVNKKYFDLIKDD